MQIDEMRVDGNAAGGILRDVFTHEMTAALATCAGCGARGPIGELLEYGQSMGVVLRWTHDLSPDQRNTRALVDRVVPVGVRALRLTRFRPVRPLVKELLELLDNPPRGTDPADPPAPPEPRATDLPR